MDFSKRRADPRRYLAGAAAVVLFHALLIYGLVSGLARKVVERVDMPVETQVIEEVAKPAPPPVVLPPPPKLQAPPPPFIPPPEVMAPAPPAQAITAATPAAPPAPTVAPLPAPVVAAVPAAPVVAPSAGVSCPGYEQVLLRGGYPREALSAHVDSGDVMVSFIVGINGEVKNPTIVSSTNRVFNRHSLRMVAQFKCIPQAQEVEVKAPFVFNTQPP